MNSREKVLGLRKRLLELKPEDEGSAQQLQMLAAISPMLLRALPEDPAEIDRFLRIIAWGAAQCRSDDSAELGVFELEDGGWRRVDLAAEES